MSNIWGQYQAEDKIQRFPMPIFKANKQVGRWVGTYHTSLKRFAQKSLPLKEGNRRKQRKYVNKIEKEKIERS